MTSWLVSWRAIFDIAAGLASIVGLLFSFLAWRKASGAEIAAREARASVRRSNAGEDLGTLSETANELLRSVQNRQFEAAKLRSTDLLARLAQARHRWKLFLSETGPEKLDDVTRRLSRISQAVSSAEIAVDADISLKVLRSCHEVVVALAEESGKLLKQLEGSPND